MISRSALIGALVVVELAIVGIAFRALCGGGEAATGFSSVAWAAPRVAEGPALDRTFTTGPAPHVVVDVHDVDLTVDTAPATSVRAVETLHTAGFVTGHIVPVRATATADGVRIASASPAGTRVVLGAFEHALHLTVPAGAVVEVESAGNVAAAGLRAKLAVSSTNGAIRVRDHRGDVELSTGHGRIELTDVQGATLSAISHNGRLVLNDVGADRLDANTGNGHVEARDLRVVDGTISSGNGYVRLALAANSDATVTAHSGRGRVRLHDLAAAEPGDDDRAHANVVRLGSGRGRFDVSTGNGSITLSQGAHV